MSIISYYSKIVKIIQGQALRIYLVMASMLIAIFGIWFSNVGLLPFKNIYDFAIFSVLVFIFAVYRPGWAFLFFVGSIALENINLAPYSFGIELRPYQFVGFLLAVSFAVLYLRKKIRFDFPKWSWADLAVLIFALAGFLSAVFAEQKVFALKQSFVMLSFVIFYFLTRVYIQNFSDLRKALPFFLGSSLVVAAYSIWQNIRFSRGMEHFEVMPGRPNATFTEPDWYGAYLVFILAMIFSLIYGLVRDWNVGFKIKNDGQKIKLLFYYAILTFVFIALILTVARSAWIGAAIVSLGFLKMVAFNGLWDFGKWKWKSAGISFLGVSVSFLLAIGFVKVFNLTTFELANRAQSTASGLQEITISCVGQGQDVPQVISNVSELSQYGCRHINLEDIENEKAQEKQVSTVFRPDPNVGARAEIYLKSLDVIRKNLILGIGWGNIGSLLGQDGEGNYFNSSNIFLEVWLGGGIIGFLAFVFVLLYALFKSSKIFIEDPFQRDGAVFVLLGFFAIVVPNLFNAGIFLGFLWVYLGIAVSLVNKNK